MPVKDCAVLMTGSTQNHRWHPLTLAQQCAITCITV